MDKKEIKLNLSSDLLARLESMAKNKNTDLEKLIEEILSDNVDKKSKKQETKLDFPSVALFKEAKKIEIVSPAQSKKAVSKLNPLQEKTENFSKELNSPVQRPTIYSPETIARQKRIEAEMKELSLLIETASDEEKKADYLFKYALLASEMDALY